MQERDLIRLMEPQRCDSDDCDRIRRYFEWHWGYYGEHTVNVGPGTLSLIGSNGVVH